MKKYFQGYWQLIVIMGVISISVFMFQLSPESTPINNSMTVSGDYIQVTVTGVRVAQELVSTLLNEKYTPKSGQFFFIVDVVVLNQHQTESMVIQLGQDNPTLIDQNGKSYSIVGCTLPLPKADQAWMIGDSLSIKDGIALDPNKEQPISVAFVVEKRVKGQPFKFRFQNIPEIMLQVPGIAFDTNATPDDNLLKAIQEGGMVQDVQKALDDGADVNTKIATGDLKGVPALIVAIMNGQIEPIQLLLEHGADVNVTDKNGNPVLALAIQEGLTDIIKLLLEHGADVNVTDKNENPVLTLAIQKGLTDIVKLLIEHGVDVNAKITAKGRFEGATPLIAAKFENRTEIVDLLKKAGATENEKREYIVSLKRMKDDIRAIGNALGSYQVDWNHFPICSSEKDLSDIGLPTEYYEGPYTDTWGTPFKYISEVNGQDYTLTSYGADKAKGDGGNLFDADIAYSNGMFTKAIADVDGDLLKATEQGAINAAQSALANGANVDVRKDGGVTALMIAAEKGYTDVVKFLIDHGAAVNTTLTKGDCQGVTALAMAKSGNWLQIIDLLKKAGAIDDNNLIGDSCLRSKTVADMRAIGIALGNYQVDQNFYPISPSEKDLSDIGLPTTYKGGYTDAWGTSFKYISEAKGESYILTSYGADKTKGSGGSEFDSDIIYSNGQFVAPASLVHK